MLEIDVESRPSLSAASLSLGGSTFRVVFTNELGTDSLIPYMGCGYSSPAGDAIRVAVNQWIRTTPELDGFIDFDKVTRDPTNPIVFAPGDDSGDHLHPGDAGYKAMGDAIDLKLFTK